MRLMSERNRDSERERKGGKKTEKRGKDGEKMTAEERQRREKSTVLFLD